jgi:hypothetical protein
MPLKRVPVLFLVGLAFLSTPTGAHHCPAVLELVIPPQVELDKKASFEVTLKNRSDQMLFPALLSRDPLHGSPNTGARAQTEFSHRALKQSSSLIQDPPIGA